MNRKFRNREWRQVAVWASYDWANSAFPTCVVTFIYATYFTQAIASDELSGTTAWSRAVAVSSILAALLSPLAGALADRGGRRAEYLVSATLVCCAATALLTFVAPGLENAVLLALVLFAIANLSFEMGTVFYNAFLPELAPQDAIGRASGWSWGFGYAGGLVCLALALPMALAPDLLGVSTEEGFNYRAANLLVAIWFAVFSVPMLRLAFRLRPASRPRVPLPQAYRDVVATMREVRQYSEAAKLLLARLVYNDGLVTVFAFGGIYAAGTFGMSLTEVIIFGIAINVTAGAGALAFGFLDDRLGGKRTILITLAGLILCGLVAVFAPTEAWFWVAGLALGVFVGPNQAASRSLFARFVPEAKRNEFFGFFSFSGKISAFAGPLLLGSATAAFSSQRAGMATVLIFFVAGGALLLWVNEARGIEEGRASKPPPGAAGS